MDRSLPRRLAANVRQLREGRGLTQDQMAKLAGIPRATWSHVESGSGNPTLAVLDKLASALQVPIEELTTLPGTGARLYARGALRERHQGDGTVRQLLPDPIPGMVIERMSLPPQGRIPGVPHTAGTREYLTCESGEIVLMVAGERFRVGPGDVVTFRGDQRHSYQNPCAREAVGYSVVVLARI